MKRRYSAFVGLACAAASAVAAQFPYGVDEPSMETRHRLDSAAYAAFDEPVEVPAVRGGMPTADSVATLFAKRIRLNATGAARWDACAETLGTGLQAALAIRRETNGSLVWMGFSGGVWTALEGVAAAEREWFVRVDLDYSLGAGNRLIRYSVSSDGGTTFVALHPADADAWMPIGSEAQRLASVRLYCVGAAGETVAKSGARPLAIASTATFEDMSMNCDRLSLAVTPEDAWGVTGARVVLKDADGRTIATQTGKLEDGTIAVTFDRPLTPGAAYAYEVTLTGEYNDQPVESAGRNSSVEMCNAVDWFGFADGAFVRAVPDAGVTVADGAFGSADDGVMGRIVPQDGTVDHGKNILTALVRVDGSHEADELEALDLGTPQAALTLMRGADGTRSWACRTADGWREVSGAGVPTVNGTYEVRMQIDYSETAPTVAYEIKVGGNYEMLSDGVTTRFALPAGASKMADLGIVGRAVSALNVGTRTTDPVPPSIIGGQIVLKDNSSLDLADGRIAAGQSYDVANAAGGRRLAHLRWSDANGKYAKLVGNRLTVTSTPPANGLESFFSYVLGLDMTDELAKPAAVVKPGGIQSADGITVHVPNVLKGNLPVSGYEVLFQRQKLVNGAWQDDGDPAKVGESLTIPFENATLYRVNTILR